MNKGHTWIALSGSGVALRDPCVISSVIITAAAAGDSATLYDGLDPSSGREFAPLKASHQYTNKFQFSQGVVFENGIYVTFSANLERVVLVLEYLQPGDI